MNEPLVCWVGLLLLAAWGSFSTRSRVQLCLGKYLKACVRLIQWYNLSWVFLTLFFARTLMDIIKFDFVKYQFLDSSIYMDNCADVPEAAVGAGSIGLPDILRVVSLLGPVFGSAAFLVVLFQVSSYVRCSWRLKGDDYAQWVSDPKVYMPLLVIGMPMVYVVMALRATIRQWAIMTCSSWVSFHAQDPDMTWHELKALELATYNQDLAIANAFQFFAVWCFGMACSQALENVTLSHSEDRYALAQAGILGVHAFVFIGFVRSIINFFLAACSSQVGWQESITSIEATLANKVDPMFMFATVLCVINMFVLGRMTEVKKVLGNVNLKFNATRALLLIGQGQMSVLMALTTENADKVLKFVHKVPGLEDFEWDLSHDQARLWNSSLLCLECLLVALLNARVWNPQDTVQMANQAYIKPLLQIPARP